MAQPKRAKISTSRGNRHTALTRRIRQRRKNEASSTSGFMSNRQPPARELQSRAIVGWGNASCKGKEIWSCPPEQGVPFSTNYSSIRAIGQTGRPVSNSTSFLLNFVTFLRTVVAHQARRQSYPTAI